MIGVHIGGEHEGTHAGRYTQRFLVEVKAELRVTVYKLKKTMTVASHKKPREVRTDSPLQPPNEPALDPDLKFLASDTVNINFCGYHI